MLYFYNGIFAFMRYKTKYMRTNYTTYSYSNHCPYTYSYIHTYIALFMYFAKLLWI